MIRVIIMNLIVPKQASFARTYESIYLTYPTAINSVPVTKIRKLRLYSSPPESFGLRKDMALSTGFLELQMVGIRSRSFLHGTSFEILCKQWCIESW